MGMEAREVITLKGWVDGSGWSYEQTYSDKVVKISDPNSIDWDWWESSNKEGEDTMIVVELYSLDGELIARHEKWASEIQK